LLGRLTGEMAQICRCRKIVGEPDRREGTWHRPRYRR